MAEALKNMYNQSFVDEFTIALKNIYLAFDKVSYSNQLFDNEWEQKELKQRMRHFSICLKTHLPDDYPEAVSIILRLVDYLKSNNSGMSFEYMFLPDYIEQYGLDDYETSIHAFQEITQFTSCEFAVRPFIIKHPKAMMEQMLTWSKHEHHGVRRFSTEGCRPRLPWAMALPELKKNPSSILLILENLKNDESDFVRKSVANNLNDISKDNPELVISIVKQWQGHSKNTDWIIKHACRTLLKQGNNEVMEIFGFGSTKNIGIDKIEIHTPKVNIGDYLSFSFKLSNENNRDTLIRLEYGLYYLKANGSLSKKVFKISEKTYPANSQTIVNRKQSFRLISTRKYHLGEHRLSIIVNGKEFGMEGFVLIE